MKIIYTLALVGSFMFGYSLSGIQYSEALQERLYLCGSSETHTGYAATDGHNWVCFRESTKWPHRAYASIIVKDD